jgi:hypothetical protein
LTTRQYYDKKYENSDTPFKEPSTSLGLSAGDVLRCISDPKALSLFKAIALSERYDTSIIMTKLRLSRKQYYTRMKKLIRTGLVKRISGKYYLTSFGKVVFSIEVKIIESAIKHHRSLKSIDSIVMTSAEEKQLPAQELQKIIGNLIDNQEIKDILVSNRILITR